MVTNLHYEITPRDLTVRPDPLLPRSHVMTFAPSGGNFWASGHARARAIHQGTKVRLPLPRVVVVEDPQPSRSSIPGFCYVDASAFLFLRVVVLYLLLNVSMIVAAARRALLSSRSRHLQRQREQKSS
jgi:hypothetical protein